MHTCLLCIWTEHVYSYMKLLRLPGMAGSVPTAPAVPSLSMVLMPIVQITPQLLRRHVCSCNLANTV